VVQDLVTFRRGIERAIAGLGVLTLTLGVVVAPRAGAAPSPCGRSFIDVDNDGVCSPGDVPLAGVLKPLGTTGPLPSFVDIDVTNEIVDADFMPVYEPPADDHPVGVVLGGNVTINNGDGIHVFATGTLAINGRIYGNNEAFEQFESCRAIIFGRGALLADQGSENEPEINLQARADLCPLETTAPATLELGKGARLVTSNFMPISADILKIDDHAQLRSTPSTLGSLGDFRIQAGSVQFGRSVKIFGPGFLEMSMCGGDVSATHLLVQIADFHWQQTGYPCDETLSNGVPYNVTSVDGQRLTFTSSRFSVSQGGLVSANPGQNGYPCDAVTLVKTRVIGGNLSFFPTPRVNPTGPCTGTIPG